MSAYVDKSQGITFVYSNIYSIYKKAKETKLDAPFVIEPQNQRVIKKEHAKVEEYKPKNIELSADSSQRTFAVPMGVREAEEKAKKINARPIGKLQKNLADLSDAHEKLRFLLSELEELTKKKD